MLSESKSMKPIEIARLTKQEIIWLSKKHCKHGHPYISHWKCYLRERKNQTEERACILDLETSGLRADFGMILSYAIKEVDGDTVTGVITRKEMHEGTYDRRLVEEIVHLIMQFDRVIGYYIKNKRFDIPFLRSRALFHGLWFPTYLDLKVTDVYDAVKLKLKLRSSRLQTACDFLGIKAKGHPMNPKVWFAAMHGDPEALQYIVTHNIEDVESTEKLYKMLKDYQRPDNCSI